MKIKAVLFDMDGVLVNSMPIHLTAFQQILSPYGATISLSEIAGKSTRSILSEVLGKSKNSPELERLVTRKTELSIELMRAEGRNLLRPQAIEILDYASARYLTALCTSASANSTAFVLEELIPPTYFDAIVNSAMVAHSKPSPDIYEMATRLLSVTPKDCLVIEDSWSGAVAANRAGCHVALIGMCQSQPIGSFDAIVTESLSDIRDLLELWSMQDHAT
jgi:HAD superfamily hydrolase (TIGR01509 family)